MPFSFKHFIKFYVFLLLLWFANYTKNYVCWKESLLLLVCIWWFSDIPRLIYRTIKREEMKRKPWITLWCCLFELKLINPEYPCMLHKEWRAYNEQKKTKTISSCGLLNYCSALCTFPNCSILFICTIFLNK